jgi:hypothetical protein
LEPVSFYADPYPDFLPNANADLGLFGTKKFRREKRGIVKQIISAT